MVGFVIMAGSQIAIPLADQRTDLTGVVIAGFAVTSFGFAADAWGAVRSAAALVFVLASTLLIEWVGSTTGFPFGGYSYTAGLRPQIAGVPVIVPLAWFAMGIPALVIGRRLSEDRLGRVFLAALALTAWDLFLDPQMVDEGHWVWTVQGLYEGIPLTNYAGWILAGVIVLGVVDLVVGAETVPPSRPLMTLYTWWAVMNTIGLIVFFGLPIAGVVGGAAMGGLVYLAWRRETRKMQ